MWGDISVTGVGRHQCNRPGGGGGGEDISVTSVDPHDGHGFQKRDGAGGTGSSIHVYDVDHVKPSGSDQQQADEVEGGNKGQSQQRLVVAATLEVVCQVRRRCLQQGELTVQAEDVEHEEEEERPQVGQGQSVQNLRIGHKRQSKTRLGDVQDALTGLFGAMLPKMAKMTRPDITLVTKSIVLMITASL